MIGEWREANSKRTEFLLGLRDFWHSNQALEIQIWTFSGRQTAIPGECSGHNLK